MVSITNSQLNPVTEKHTNSDYDVYFRHPCTISNRSCWSSSGSDDNDTPIAPSRGNGFDGMTFDDVTNRRDDVSLIGVACGLVIRLLPWSPEENSRQIKSNGLESDGTSVIILSLSVLLFVTNRRRKYLHSYFPWVYHRCDLLFEWKDFLWGGDHLILIHHHHWNPQFVCYSLDDFHLVEIQLVRVIIVLIAIVLVVFPLHGYHLHHSSTVLNCSLFRMISTNFS